MELNQIAIFFNKKAIARDTMQPMEYLGFPGPGDKVSLSGLPNLSWRQKCKE